MSSHNVRIDWTKSPYKNPYSAGKPIYDEKRFFGREKIFRKAHAHLVGEHPNRPIVIYGQRRMGKTSVLIQMERRLNAIFGSERYVAVWFDLQAFTLRGIDNFWLELAQFIRDTITRNYAVPKPDLTLFESDAHNTFRDHFLPTVQSAIGERRLVLMFDECLRLSQVVAQQRLPTTLFEQFRCLMEQQEQISFIYSLATPVDTLQPEYQKMLKDAFLLHVTFLSQKAAHALVTEPIAEFYEFDDEAIKYLLDLTHRQAYFTQSFCKRLFMNFKLSKFTRVTRADVLAVLDQVTNSTMMNLSYLWIEATVAEKFVLAAIAEMEADQASVRTLDRHLKQAGIYLGRSHIERALKGLHQREVISSTIHPRINLGMLRYWLGYAKSLWSVGRKFREYLPSVPFKNKEAQISQALTVALTKPWVREPYRAVIW